MDYNYLPLDSTPVNLNQFRMMLQYKQHISITFQAWEAVEYCRNYLDEKLAANPGALDGLFNNIINLSDATETSDETGQEPFFLLKSHAKDRGEEVPEEIAKLMIALKVKSLSYGHSGVQNPTIQRLMDMHNNDVIPVVYMQNSKDDFSALSHLCLPVIGLGAVWYKGEKNKPKEVEAALGWKQVHLKTPEEIALVTGTQYMLSYGIWCLLKAEHLMDMADLLAALSFDALGCSVLPLSEPIHQLKPNKGQSQSAANMRKWLAGSEIAGQEGSQSPTPDALLFTPQVHGATRDAMKHVAEILLSRVNAPCEATYISPDENLILDSGNYSSQPLALALEFMKLAIDELANISDLRAKQIEKKTNRNFFPKPREAKGSDTVSQCLKAITNLKSSLAGELLVSVKALETWKPLKSSQAIENLIEGFKGQVEMNNGNKTLYDPIPETMAFIDRLRI